MCARGGGSGPERDAYGGERHAPADGDGAPRPACWPDDELAARLRARDDAAPRELYRRLEGVLALEARRLRVEPGERREVIADVLRAVCTTLAGRDGDVPASLAAYAVRALQRRVRLLARLAQDGPEPLEDALHVPARDGDGDEASVPEGRRGVVGRMALAVADALTAEEQELLVWLAEHVPQREIAEWRGATFGAMRGRILRLRERARKLALRWVAALPPDERARLARRFDPAARARSYGTGRRPTSPSGGNDDAAT